MAPWRYFVGPEAYWNWFDLVIVILSLPFMETTLYATSGSGGEEGGGGGSKVAVMHLLRLST